MNDSLYMEFTRDVWHQYKAAKMSDDIGLIQAAMDARTAREILWNQLGREGARLYLDGTPLDWCLALAARP